jgi:hypothetical protein
MSRPALGPYQPSIQWVWGPLSPGVKRSSGPGSAQRVKRPGREADHSCHIVQKSRIVELYLHPLLINDRENFTFTLLSSLHHPWRANILLHEHFGSSGYAKRSKTLQEKRRWKSLSKATFWNICFAGTLVVEYGFKEESNKDKIPLFNWVCRFYCSGGSIFLRFLSFPRLLVWSGVSVLSAPF